MATLSQQIERLQNLKDNILPITVSSINETKENILTLNAEQLASGLDSLGNKTSLDGSDFYRPSTIRRKKKYGVGIGAITDHVTLYDTGAMHKSETVEVQGEDVVTDFNTDYSKFVIERTGNVVLGLSPENKSNYIYGPLFEAMRPKIEAIVQLPLQ